MHTFRQKVDYKLRHDGEGGSEKTCLSAQVRLEERRDSSSSKGEGKSSSSTGCVCVFVCVQRLKSGRRGRGGGGSRLEVWQEEKDCLRCSNIWSYIDFHLPCQPTYLWTKKQTQWWRQRCWLLQWWQLAWQKVYLFLFFTIYFLFSYMSLSLALSSAPPFFFLKKSFLDIYTFFPSILYPFSLSLLTPSFFFSLDFLPFLFNCISFLLLFTTL